MDTHGIKNFFRVLGESLQNRWSEAGLREVAQLHTPTGIFGKNEGILRADYSMTLGRWFLEGLVDLNRHVHGAGNIGHLYEDIMQCMLELDQQAKVEDIRDVSRQLAVFAWREVQARRNAGRLRIDRALRNVVWFQNDPIQRCYLCGYRFTPGARDLFLGRPHVPLEALRLVDFTRPRGVRPRHLAVEVDHVIPVAEGGKTEPSNLRLACGWCNIVKSNLWSVYDAKAWSAGVLHHPSLGPVSVPQPLWALRILATRARCEAREDCSAQLTTHELFVAPRNPKGALTPTNLMVVCRRHDPWVAHRLIKPDLLPAR